MKQGILVITVVLITTFLIMGGTNFKAEQAAQPETMELVPMMRLLLSDMQLVDEGMYTEDYSQIAEGAGSIADHPRMTEEDKKLIKKTLGEQMKAFVGYDMKVHHHADSMRMAAVEEDMEEVLRHYSIVQQGCLDCHSSFRLRIMEARR